MIKIKLASCAKTLKIKLSLSSIYRYFFLYNIYHIVKHLSKLDFKCIVKNGIDVESDDMPSY